MMCALSARRSPHGPYILFGLCVAGVIAYEAAQGRLFVHRVPGGHVGMFKDEGASLIAEHLRSLLDQVDAERDQMVRSEASRA